MTLSFLSSHYIQSTRFGSLSPYVKPYITLVLNKGYKPTTIVGQLRLIARLNLIAGRSEWIMIWTAGRARFGALPEVRAEETANAGR